MKGKNGKRSKSIKGNSEKKTKNKNKNKLGLK